MLLTASRAPGTRALPGVALFVLLLAPVSHAQKSTPVAELQPLQDGVTLPVRLHRYLRAGVVKSGTRITATTTQRIPINDHFYLHHGAQLIGEVVTSTAGGGTPVTPSTLSIRFTSLQYRGRTVPIATRAIAIANFVQVGETSYPATGSADRGNNSPASWTTVQVGGDVIDRSGWIGQVCDKSLRKVGTADYFGVYTLPLKPPNGSGLAFPHALGVFSTTASGLYGIEEGTTMHSAGGVIIFTRPEGKLLLRDGDNLLLEVVSAEQGSSTE